MPFLCYDTKKSLVGNASVETMGFDKMGFDKEEAEMSKLKMKRIYEPAEPTDGVRILVDRLWPRGMRKEDAPFQLWIKDAAPSSELRHWFGHDPERWQEFRKKYETELSANLSALQPLLDIARQGTLTLLYAAHDETHNNAVVLAEYLQHLLSPRKPD